MLTQPARILALLLLTAGAAYAADAPAPLDELKAQLEAVRQEQQSVYQTYEMTKEQRRLEVEQGSLPIQQQQPYGSSIYTPPPDYYDVLRQQTARERRIRQYTGDMMNLSDRYFQLEDQRRELLRQIEKLQKQQ